MITSKARLNRRDTFYTLYEQWLGTSPAQQPDRGLDIKSLDVPNPTGQGWQAIGLSSRNHEAHICICNLNRTFICTREEIVRVLYSHQSSRESQ